ncbi:MAG: hypothetical protein EA399_01815 [Desulfovibrionales bacterium]|nr:MAG: hypothetical protein EA399_01815 [Desulfovibrionales bacterium]
MAEAKTTEKKIPVLATQAVENDNLKAEIRRLKSEGYRLVTLTCVDLDEEHVDLLYSFDKDLEMVHLRMQQPKSTPAPSISDILFGAFLVENEIQDQFGICFDGLVLNFENYLYLEEEVARTPFCKYSVIRKDAQ